jgi:hypothetical protein
LSEALAPFAPSQSRISIERVRALSSSLPAASFSLRKRGVASALVTPSFFARATIELPFDAAREGESAFERTRRKRRWLTLRLLVPAVVAGAGLATFMRQPASLRRESIVTDGAGALDSAVETSPYVSVSAPIVVPSSVLLPVQSASSRPRLPLTPPNVRPPMRDAGSPARVVEAVDAGTPVRPTHHEDLLTPDDRK